MSTQPKTKKRKSGSEGGGAATGKSKNKSKTASAEPLTPGAAPTSLFGLYSTSYEDFCSGAWFPISFVKHVETGPQPQSEAGTPSGSGRILARWSSTRHYAPDELNLSFVRSAREFVRLPIEHIKPGKRVLVRDVLEDSDFTGVSYWLATINSEPIGTTPKGKTGKKRLSAAPEDMMVKVIYQNSLWPPGEVPVTSIFVLPKAKAPLPLIPANDQEVETSSDSEEEEDEQHAEEKRPEADEQMKSFDDHPSTSSPRPLTLAASDEHKVSDSTLFPADPIDTQSHTSLPSSSSSSSLSPTPSNNLFAHSTPTSHNQVDLQTLDGSTTLAPSEERKQQDA